MIPTVPMYPRHPIWLQHKITPPVSVGFAEPMKRYPVPSIARRTTMPITDGSRALERAVRMWENAVMPVRIFTAAESTCAPCKLPPYLMLRNRLSLAVANLKVGLRPLHALFNSPVLTQEDYELI